MCLNKYNTIIWLQNFCRRKMGFLPSWVQTTLCGKPWRWRIRKSLTNDGVVLPKMIKSRNNCTHTLRLQIKTFEINDLFLWCFIGSWKKRKKHKISLQLKYYSKTFINGFFFTRIKTVVNQIKNRYMNLYLEQSTTSMLFSKFLCSVFWFVISNFSYLDGTP